MSRILFRMLPFICLQLFFAQAGLADWQSIGGLAASEHHGNQITFSSRQATVIVTVLAPDLVRVRMVRATSPGLDHSYAVVKTDWSNVPVEFAGDKETSII